MRAKTAKRLALALALLAALGVLPAFAFRNYAVPSASMLPALGPGDVVTAEFYGVDYAALASGKPFDPKAGEQPEFQPKRGDIAAFKLPDGTDYIKRIVGIGGDRVQMRGGRLFLNGAAVATVPVAAIDGGCEAGDTCAFFRETLPGGASYVTSSTEDGSVGDDTAEFVVPRETFFMLGDSRDRSLDSRFPAEDGFGGIGFVPRGALVGRVARIVSSPRGEPPAAERLQGFPNAK